MKKIITYLSLSYLFVTNVLKAQEITSFKKPLEKNKFYIGIKQSIGIANISGAKKGFIPDVKKLDLSKLEKINPNIFNQLQGAVGILNGTIGILNDVKTSAIFSQTGGLYGGYRFDDALSLQAELLYSKQGVDFKHSAFKDAKISVRTSYINFPVLAQYTFPTGIYIEAGPQLSFLTRTSYSIDMSSLKNIKGIITYTDNDNRLLNTFDLGLALGAGYHFNDKWNANLRYTQGLSKVTKDIKEPTKNSVFQLGVGYTF